GFAARGGRDWAGLAALVDAGFSFGPQGAGEYRLGRHYHLAVVHDGIGGGLGRDNYHGNRVCGPWRHAGRASVGTGLAVVVCPGAPFSCLSVRTGAPCASWRLVLDGAFGQAKQFRVWAKTAIGPVQTGDI